MRSKRTSPSPSSPKRERRSETAGRSLVTAWESGGLPQAVFARRRGVSAQRLSYWRLRLGRRVKAVAISDAGFVEISSAPSIAPIGSSVVIVEVSRGVRVHVIRGFDPLVLRAVVAALATPVPGC